MRIPVIALALVVLWQGMGYGASRTWKSRKGEEVKAEFTGVLNGKVVLKLPGGIRKPVRLSDLSLEDRDFLVQELTKRGRKKEMDQLLQLMAAENNLPVIDPDAVRRNPNEGMSPEEFPAPVAGINRPLPGNPLNPNIPQQPVEVETEMYGLPLPSPELLVEDAVRSWTSLTGQTQLAKFDRVLAPGFLRLKKADGSTGNFAIVNFSKEDIEYVKQALQKDMARPVFPEGSGFQSLTPEDVSKGYRVWTDRRKVPLVGKFVAVKGKDVVIEVNGENQEYPKAGLSEADLTWVNNEIRRRAEEAAALASSNSGGRFSSNPGDMGGGRFPFSRPPRFGVHSDPGTSEDYADGQAEPPNSNPFGMNNRSRFGRGDMAPRSPSFPEYEFTCKQCGRTWKDRMMFSQCPDCKDKSFFQCSRCGHEWTRTDGSLIDQCPRCANGGRDPGRDSGGSRMTNIADSGSVPAPREGQDVWMTIIYVVTGLGLLGGIVTGLIRSFG